MFQKAETQCPNTLEPLKSEQFNCRFFEHFREGIASWGKLRKLRKHPIKNPKQKPQAKTLAPTAKRPQAENRNYGRIECLCLEVSVDFIIL